MDDSGGQGFGGVFAGGASVEERPAGGGAVVLHVSVECVGQPAVISRSAVSGAQRSSGGS